MGCVDLVKEEAGVNFVQGEEGVRVGHGAGVKTYVVFIYFFFFLFVFVFFFKFLCS